VIKEGYGKTKRGYLFHNLVPQHCNSMKKEKEGSRGEFSFYIPCAVRQVVSRGKI
jgi:hypothetical protein